MPVTEQSKAESVYRIRLFAVLRDRQGASSVDVAAAEAPLRVGELLRRVADDHVALAPLLGVCRLAVDEEFVTTEAWVHPHQRIALLPPVSGG